ncbi:MAG: hypothetical protein LWW75_06425 [Chlorobiales bacterium]|nr:hypothetical protein [Chlorobiales bacterium]
MKVLQVVGIAWYRQETYGRLRAMFEDGDKLPKTYESWLTAANQLRIATEAKGMRVICVDIDPDEFPKWCIANGMSLNAAARMQFSNLMAYRVATG